MTGPLAQFEAGRRVDQWLGEMYRADVLGVGRSGDVTRRARDTIAADPLMLEYARSKVLTLEKTCRARPNAHVEAKQLEYLRKLLAEEPA